jgi:hypothetical protein
VRAGANYSFLLNENGSLRRELFQEIAKAFCDWQWPRWLPQGVFVSRYFPRRQTVAGLC